MVKATHYSLSAYPDRLLWWSRQVVHCLTIAPTIHPMLNRFIGDRIPLLMYSGMSGTAHATAVSMELVRSGKEHGLCYVRKTKEDSHGLPVELSVRARCVNVDFELLPCWAEFYYPVFVDDMVSVGATRSRSLAPLNWINVEPRWKDKYGDENGDSPYFQVLTDVFKLVCAGGRLAGEQNFRYDPFRCFGWFSDPV